MDKRLLLDTIVGEIMSSFNASLAAADQARKTATSKENVAENKYDTLGLEAAYLAHGQSERVLQLESDLASYLALRKNIKNDSAVAVGSVLKLKLAAGHSRYLFVGPASGGLVVKIKRVKVTVNTPESPLGKAVLGSIVGDELTRELGGIYADSLVNAIW